jgi:hypothetical protein
MIRQKIVRLFEDRIMLISEWSALEHIHVGIHLRLEVCKVYKKLSVSLGPSVVQ